MARTKKIVKTKKTTPKKTVSKKAPVKKTVAKKALPKLPKIVFKKPDFKSPIYKQILKVFGFVVAIIGLIALVDLGVQYINNDYSVAKVNSKRISKAKWHKNLENSYGASVADTMINDAIIELEAKKADVKVTDEDIKTQLDKIIARIGGQEAYESALKASNLTEEELKEQIRVQVLYTKVIGPSIEYTEDDLKAFFNQYSSVIFPQESAALAEGEKLDYEKYKEETKEQYIVNEVQTKQSEWLTGKKSEYSIQNNSVAKPKYGFLTTLFNLLSK